MSKSLQDWLDWQETLHPSEIDLGLQRVAQVLQRLLPECSLSPASVASISFKLPYTIITVAGTNGKGSTVAMLEAILTESGYKVGSYTSPHLLRYNERIKIKQNPVNDSQLCQSFERIDQARESLSLTYFEFGTLAAIDIFYQQSCDIVILEVGLGGRLDAVNIVDADVALVTTVDIDHQDWLGSDRDSIGIEKAGIYRHDKPAIYGDSDCPDSIKTIVATQQLNFYQYGEDYYYEEKNNQWNWLSNDKDGVFQTRYNLPLPNLMGNIQLKNATNVLIALELVKSNFPVSQAEIKRGLQSVQLAGRFQIYSTEPTIILDVAHNVQATQALKKSLEQLTQKSGKLHVIVGMLKDKEVSDVLAVLAPLVASWRLIDLDSPRAMPAKEMHDLLCNDILAKSKSDSDEQDRVKIDCFSNFTTAYQDFMTNKLMFNSIDKLLIFGSFFTVTDALKVLDLNGIIKQGNTENL
ncbi:bifunctional tetrahydrofolate synthase/dihydrofolate synthase [sulfur-oxidizing endosymbiont of Gigantopelta aegis]|uniref:bifunctional tetrahydrofolate synthase/dihydrofolate synthase n=1 Tax=sulfur-oxidizing endosymbiont of Gigantopelta aegis TaxID=2794934 RepID=UPI0018DCE839|nr:bifunctional tetrahydrofolate synthase/dihydrofolate synthase [sulfur-oxidizing endosymbiont of Gigantopelta aegis]